MSGIISSRELKSKMFTKLLPLCLLIAVSVGCREGPLSDLRGGAQDVLEGARTRAQEFGELSAEEIQELWAIEYRTLRVSYADLAALDEQLNALGQERWECYHVSEDGQGTVFYFKRRKSNAIAHLTNLLRVGSFAF